MSSATQTAASTPQQVELYRVRDEFAREYKPATSLERMLVTRMAQAWIRLQRAQEGEQKYFDTHDVYDAIMNDNGKYKAFTRYVAECERFWRNATQQLEKVQRRRLRTDLSSPHARRRPLPELAQPGRSVVCAELSAPRNSNAAPSPQKE